MKFNKSMDWLKESDETNILADDDLDMVDEELNEGLYVDPANYDKHNDLIDVVDKSGNPRKMTQATYDKNKGSGEFTAKEPEKKEEENFKTVEDIAGIKEDELNEWLEDNIDFSASSSFNAKQIAKKIPALKSHEKELADAIDKYSDDYTIDMPFTYAIQTTLSKTRSAQTSEPEKKEVKAGKKTSEPEKKEVKAGKKISVQNLKEGKAYVSKEDIFYGDVEDLSDDEEYIQSLKDKGLVNDNNEVVIPAGTEVTFRGSVGGAYAFDVNGEELDMSMDDVDLYEVEKPEKKANDKSKASKLTSLQRDVIDAINKDPKRNYSIDNLYNDFMDDAELAADIVARSDKNMSNVKLLSLVKDKYRKIFTNPEDLKAIDRVANYTLSLFRGY